MLYIFRLEITVVSAQPMVGDVIPQPSSDTSSTAAKLTNHASSPHGHPPTRPPGAAPRKPPPPQPKRPPSITSPPSTNPASEVTQPQTNVHKEQDQPNKGAMDLDEELHEEEESKVSPTLNKSPPAHPKHPAKRPPPPRKLPEKKPPPIPSAPSISEQPGGGGGGEPQMSSKHVPHLSAPPQMKKAPPPLPQSRPAADSPDIAVSL